MKRGKTVFWVSLTAFALITAWYGSNLLLLTTDYRDEIISVESLQISIVNVEIRDNYTILVTVHFYNNYSRDLAIRLVTFLIFDRNSETLLVSGMKDYTQGLSEPLILPGYSGYTEEFTRDIPRENLVQIKTNTPIEIRAEVRVAIKSVYFKGFTRKAVSNMTITFH